MHHPLVVPCARGTETVAARELEALDLPAESQPGALRLRGSLEDAYRVALYHRTGTRVLWQLVQETLPDPDALYERLRTLPWEAHLGLGSTFAVDAVCAGDRRDHDTRFLALRVKDAIVDWFRDVHGERPSVDRRDPDLRLHLHWGSTVTLAVDLFGPLHRRGYRPRGAPAPMKETLAASVLLLSGWSPDTPLVDPMCGSGTLLVEAAMLAKRIAPGLGRRPAGWRGHDASLWERLCAEAKGQQRDAPALAHGFDADPRAVALARESADRAGVTGSVVVQRGDLKDLRAPAPAGHLVVNPPYGERLGEAGELGPLYEEIGDVLKRRFGGWTAHVLTANRALEKRVGLRPGARHALYNGPLACRLSSYSIRAAQGDGPGWRKASKEAVPFANRLRKNLGKLTPWSKREGIGAWRAYDADIPEFNLAVDVFELPSGRAVLVQEFHRPSKVEPARADRRLRDAMLIAGELLETERVALRVRRRQGRKEQYERRGEGARRERVVEGGHTFLVNLEDYLDTGIFPDQRKLRARMAEEARDGRFLNLFAYTCSASVYAAAAGATTTSVDLSSTYLDWGRAHFRENNLDPSAHRFERGDVRRVLGRLPLHDVTFLAPPSYSRSKAMDGDLDLVRDHRALIEASMEVTRGALYFATHAKGFALDPRLRGRFVVEELSRTMRPRDYPRSAFAVWRLGRR